MLFVRLTQKTNVEQEGRTITYGYSRKVPFVTWSSDEGETLLSRQII